MRKFRAQRDYPSAQRQGLDIVTPDPSPQKRWTHGSLCALFSELGFPQTCHDYHIAVPVGKSRLKARGAICATYEKGIPTGAFIDAGNGVVISGPELLFVELAESMHPLEHLMLGHELCGAFSRDPFDPYNGPIAYGVAPVTSAQRIRDLSGL